MLKQDAFPVSRNVSLEDGQPSHADMRLLQAVANDVACAAVRDGYAHAEFAGHHIGALCTRSDRACHLRLILTRPQRRGSEVIEFDLSDAQQHGTVQFQGGWLQ